jgi:hypothetical protein
MDTTGLEPVTPTLSNIKNYLKLLYHRGGQKNSDLIYLFCIKLPVSIAFPLCRRYPAGCRSPNPNPGSASKSHSPPAPNGTGQTAGSVRARVRYTEPLC